MNGLDLFSGIGGISIALSPWVRTVAYCESDRYAQGVLLSRMRSGDIDRAPIWDDVRTLRAKHLPRIDIITGGFPCQDISVAGAGKGLEGERSGLFFEIARLTSELRPRFVFLENVPAITVRGLDRVCLEFTKMGYDCRWTTITAASVGACHRRERWFMLAYDTNGISKRLNQGSRSDLRSELETSVRSDSDNFCNQSNVTDTNGEHRGEQLQSKFNKQTARPIATSEEKLATDTMREGLEGYWHRTKRKESKLVAPCVYRGWKSKPTVRRGVDGVSYRVDKLRCLGNSVVPLQVMEAFIYILNLKTTDQDTDQSFRPPCTEH